MDSKSVSDSSTQENLLYPLGGIFRLVILILTVALSTVLFANLVLISYVFVFPFDKQRHSLHRIGVVWAKTIVLLNPWWKFEFEGVENIPRNGEAVVYVANHLSQTDILAMYILGIRFRWLSKEEIFKIPLMGWAMSAIGYVPVRRGNKSSHAECMEHSKKHLLAGTPMVFFPEGTRSTDGVMASFKVGAFKLAHEARVPVVPVTISGSDRLLPKGSLRPRPARVKIIIHPRVSSDKSINDLLNKARDVVAQELPPEKRGRQSNSAL